jgi:hypothetical protein
MEAQVIARAWRIGCTHQVKVQKLIMVNTVEEVLWKINSGQEVGCDAIISRVQPNLVIERACSRFGGGDGGRRVRRGKSKVKSASIHRPSVITIRSTQSVFG